ncbi:hypothetical protein Tco_0503516 [Tanacetum coccineum]
MIAPGSSRNSQEESYGSNNMAHNYFIEEARKREQERNRNSKPSVMHTTSLQNTTNGSKPKPRSNNQTYRSLPVSKSSYVTSNVVPLVDHSRNPSSFSDSKHFVCLTCQKCVFNAIHDACLTKFLKEILTGHKFSPNKSSAVWVLTGKIFTSTTTKVDSEPPNGSKEDITNPYECEQTLNGFKEFQSDKQEQWLLQTTLQAPFFKEKKGLVPNPAPTAPYVPPTKNDWDLLFQPMFDEFFNPPPSVVYPVPVVAAPRPVDLTSSTVSTLIDQDATSAKSTSQVSSSNVRPSHTTVELLGRWTKNHQIKNVIRYPSRSFSTRKELKINAMWCYFDAFLTSVEPKNYKEAMLEPSWIEAM